MAKFIEHFQKVAHISGNSVERSYQDNIEAMSACISQKLVEARAFRFCSGNGVRIFMDNLKSPLLGQFTEVIKLCFRVLVAGGYARIDDSAFAGTSFGRNFDFGG